MTLTPGKRLGFLTIAMLVWASCAESDIGNAKPEADLPVMADASDMTDKADTSDESKDLPPPMLEFGSCFLGEQEATGTCEDGATALDFTDIPYGPGTTRRFRLSNDGSQAFKVTDAQLSTPAAEFSLAFATLQGDSTTTAEFPVEIPPGEAFVLEVTYLPTLEVQALPADRVTLSLEMEDIKETLDVNMTGGSAGCADGFGDCDDQRDTGCEANLQEDMTHCGGCGQLCEKDNQEAMCVEGMCTAVGMCNMGYAECPGTPGCVTNTQEDVANCGGCGISCQRPNATGVCDTGSCSPTCDTGFLDCNMDLGDVAGNGCEMFVLNDPMNCGACGKVCTTLNGTPWCTDGNCAIQMCNDGFNDCDEEVATGCETNTRSDPDNCGGCGLTQGAGQGTNSANVCPNYPHAARMCNVGVCEQGACDVGWGDCTADPGCETDITTISNCGGCGNLDAQYDCSAQYPNAITSCGAACDFVQCETGYWNLDEPGAPAAGGNGCEYMCSFVSTTDLPNDAADDTNCDGIDGDISRAIFVRGVGGSDSANGLTPGTALATIERALTLAGTPAYAGRDQILIAAGTYNISSRLNARSGVGMYGGYTPDFKSRDISQRANVVSTASTAIRFQSLSRDTQISAMDFRTTDRTGNGLGTFAVQVQYIGSYLSMRHVDIEAGKGSNGTHGNNGVIGSSGGRGGNASGSTRGTGGSGGGGLGGSGRHRAGGYSGSSGSDNGNASTCGGNRGLGGPHAYDGNSEDGMGCGDGDPSDHAKGQSGFDGCQGNRGTHGTRGDDTGVVTGLTWSRSNGGSGSRGNRGGGGGGGGAGGGENANNCCLFGCDYFGTGRGGGGGGGGGEGGSGGAGGSGGGASVAIMLASGNLSVHNVRIYVRGGGNGGNGGQGGPGGARGLGGNGAPSTNSREGQGGNGGHGGRGGYGGNGGGGGGGPSIGVWRFGGSISGSMSYGSIAPGGAGGTGMSSNSGRAGKRANACSGNRCQNP